MQLVHRFHCGLIRLILFFEPDALIKHATKLWDALDEFQAYVSSHDDLTHAQTIRISYPLDKI